MNVTILVAVAIFSSITAPLILSLMQGRQRRKDKEEDWERQDRLAKAAHETAILAANSLADSSKEIAAVAREQFEITDNKLDVIHQLVNSNLTAAMEGEMEALVGQRALMVEMLDLKATSGQPDVSPETKKVLYQIDLKIAELRIALADREIQTPKEEKTDGLG